MQALARDWQASLASVARALAIPEDPRQSLREYDWVALAERMPALASGKASELSFHTGAIRTSALGRELWRHLTALRVMLGLPAPARERLLAEAPPILSLHLLLFAFDGDKSWIDDFIDVQRESLALVRDALGSVLGPVRTLTARAAAELDGPTPPRLGNRVNFVAQFFTARGGWNELPEGERDTAAAIGTAVDAARIAAARRDTETAESLLAFAATLGDRA
ncbi:MAG TPA: hypothetical protein VGK73_20815 [Polyangiaceae bacterium]